MHLLVAPSALLDETGAAVDLGQTPADVVVLSFSDNDLVALASAWTEDAAQDAARLPSLRLASLKQLRHPLSVDLYVERVLAHAKLVIVRGLGGLDYWRYGFERAAAVARERGILLAALPGDDRADPRLAEISTLPPDVTTALDAYFRAGGSGNLRSALRLAANQLGDGFEIDPVRPVGAAVAMTISGDTCDLDSIELGEDTRRIALIVFYRSSLLAADTRPISALMTALEGRDLRPLAIAVTSLKDPLACAAIDNLVAQHPPSIILNATAFSGMRDDDTTVLDQVDVPVLQVALAGTSRDIWEASPRGLSSTDLAMNVVLPELDGRIFTRAISFKAGATLDPRLEYATVMHEPAVDAINHVAELAAAWVRLGTTPRSKRRIALVLSDYPARAGRIGYAVGLDAAASVAEILSLLRAKGFDTGGQHWSASAVMPHLEAHGTTLAVSLSEYQLWLDALPEPLRAEITGTWGAPERDPAFADGSFRFPIIRAGGVTVLVQPDRGARADRKSGFHDTTCPPRHGYLALYAALRQREYIDAMIHLGTHGTLEWLPGKALALSPDCWPHAVLGPLPVIYPFIVNNPGEAAQAKRRLGAVTLGHMTPPLSDAVLSGNLAALEGLIEEYVEAAVTDRRRANLIEREVLDQARASGLAAECGIAATDTPSDAIAKIDAQLCDIKDLAIRDGLHVFGRAPDATDVDALSHAIQASTRSDGGAPVALSLIRARIANCAEAERNALIAALDGRRIAPGPAGAPTRGRLDVLPTGRNLTTTDPRAIPTRTAAQIGSRAAQEVIRRHLQDEGEYPRSIVLDMWASATLRTGGDDLAQALAYLGVRPIWDPGSNRVTGVEVIPLAKMDRPRIDVTLRISGLFRDIFETQIALFVSAVRLVAALDEDEEWNPLAVRRRKGENLSRVFGGAYGTYGASVAELALDGAWCNRDELALAYLANGSYAWSGSADGAHEPDAFKERITAADALVHPQDDRERDLLDGDGIADYAGGFAAAAAMLGKSPRVYHLDTSRTDRITARGLPEEIARVVRGRLANPRWIASMLRHGHRGVAEIAQGVDALYAFAATTDAVPGSLFDTLHEALTGDEAIVRCMLDANPAAATAIAARLGNALARGLWTPRRNAVHAELERLNRAAHSTPPDAEAAE